MNNIFPLKNDFIVSLKKNTLYSTNGSNYFTYYMPHLFTNASHWKRTHYTFFVCPITSFLTCPICSLTLHNEMHIFITQHNNMIHSDVMIWTLFIPSQPICRSIRRCFSFCNVTYSDDVNSFHFITFFSMIKWTLFISSQSICRRKG